MLKTTKDINARDNEPARSETGEAPIKKRKRTDVKHAVEVEVEEKDFNDTNARDDKPQPAGSETEARR